MLDTATKRRIDTARDILVGRVPDPKSQVEQITIALIYKFMDDMDAESEEMGGQRKFFSDGFSRYGWAKLMSPSLGGHEMLGLYGEGIAKMPENPGIPVLFRDIFKNAYLPYRDPETLKAFLKIINEFEYDHSERLGDAFEYLLSVLGSQGDAGQFRTPRHIIDFMVDIMDPKKDETVLDPACGTAGFLISSYKHILKANRDEQGVSTLTPDERGRLAKNIYGYDISPDMVRLSLVNMYLHGFTDPHIYEYDTLTSEDRWNQFADVIMANPPFMSPKGGIKPHKRFSVQSKRSEVLFVDYMAEHLTPNGRAAIIVPEGIIFQNQGSYTELRRMLVENSLVAVVSLPAGVFNPYSGVKTSILILDKALARQADSVAFFKVENDGYSLGAQRRKIDRNDLPQIKIEVQLYLDALQNSRSIDGIAFTTGLVVPKKRLAGGGEYNLGGDRYREGRLQTRKFPFVPIGEVCDLINGRAFRPEDWETETSGGLQIIRIQNLNSPDSEYNYFTGEVSARHIVENGDLLFSWSGSRGTSFGAHIWHGQRSVLNQHIFNVRFDRAKVVKEYLLYALNKAVAEVEENLHGGVGLVHITKGNLEKILIPLPPLEIQRELVEEVRGYQEIISSARSIVESYRPHMPVHPEWTSVPLGDLCSVGGVITTDVHGNLPYFGADSIQSNTGKLIKTDTAFAQGVSGPVYAFSGQRLLYSKIRPYLNKVTLVDTEGYCSSDMYPLVANTDRVSFAYLCAYMLSDAFNVSIKGYYERASIPKINRSQLFETTIPLPPLEAQEKLVAELDSERRLVNGVQELLTRFEKKVQETLARVWGDEVVAASAA